MASWTFEIKPWVPAAHDVEAHKRRAQAYLSGNPLGRGSSEGVTGPVVITHPDGSASVTYSVG